MLISSCINSDKYIWTKIPKTGTRAYAQLFYPGHVSKHVHDTFIREYVQHQSQYSGVTVVRNPTTRFISAIKHIAEEKATCSNPQCNSHHVNIPFESMPTLVQYLTDNWDRGCRYIGPEESADASFGVTDPSFVRSFFIPQIHWAWHPRMTIFHYERLAEFNDWINHTLGYDTSTLHRVGEVRHNHVSHLDFTDPSFVRVVERMFYDDYILYQYPLTCS